MGSGPRLHRIFEAVCVFEPRHGIRAAVCLDMAYLMQKGLPEAYIILPVPGLGSIEIPKLVYGSFETLQIDDGT